MAAVDEHGELDALRPAKVDERVQGSADRAAGIDDIVYEHDALAGDIRHVAGGNLHRDAAGREVVAVEADVEHAYGNRLALNLLDSGGEALGQGHATRPHTDEHEV